MKKTRLIIAVIIAAGFLSPAWAYDAKNIKQLQEDAQKGDADAQFDLAMAYHEGGAGMKKDDAKAVEWFKKAADQGDIGAEFNVGIAYYHGIGVAKNLPEAVKWFRMAADRGYADAQYILAAAYQNGVGGVNKDIIQVHLWLNLAEAGGNKDAGQELISMESAMTPEQIAQAKLLFAAWKPQP